MDLTVSSVNDSNNRTVAETKEEKFVEKVKTEIIKLGTGPEAKIKLKLKDGSKIKGYITEIGENQFVIMNEKTKQPISVLYPQVGQAKGNNLSKGIIITVGIAAFLVLLFVIAGSAS